jgi:hypothetical protein
LRAASIHGPISHADNEANNNIRIFCLSEIGEYRHEFRHRSNGGPGAQDHCRCERFFVIKNACNVATRVHPSILTGSGTTLRFGIANHGEAFCLIRNTGQTQ